MDEFGFPPVEETPSEFLQSHAQNPIIVGPYSKANQPGNAVEGPRRLCRLD
jgi:hypothetical protein